MNKKKVQGIIIAIDLGNYNTQAVTSEGNETKFDSRYEIGVDIDPVNNETIKYENTCYIMERGEFDLEFNKAEKNYMPNLLYAIQNVTNQKEVNIVLNVPIDSMGISEDFKEKLSNKEFQYRYKGEDRKVKVNNVAVVGEGIGSIYSLPVIAKGKSIILFDIGGRTTNVLVIVNGKIEKKFTITKGIINFYADVAQRLNSKGNNYEIEDMKRLIEENKVGDVEADKESFLNLILNKAKEKVKVDTFDKYFTGGGSIDLESMIGKMFERECHDILKDPLWTNVRGNLKIALNVWEEEK